MTKSFEKSAIFEKKRRKQNRDIWQTAIFYKMSYNTNMNNGTSAEDLERVGKLEGTKFL